MLNEISQSYCLTLREVKFIEIESIMVVARDWGGRVKNGELLFNKYSFSFAR